MGLYRQTFTHLKTFPLAFWVVIAASLLNQVGNMAYVFLMLYLTKHEGLTLTQTSFAFASVAISMLLAGLSGGSLIDKVGAAQMMIGSLFLNGCILIIFPFIHHYPAILLLCLSWGFAFGIYRPASQTFITHLATPGLYKVAFSMFRLSLNLGMSIGPALGGYIAYHSFSSIFFVNGTANLLATLVLIVGLARSSWLHYHPARKNKLEFSFKWLRRDTALRLFLIAIIPVSMVFNQHESTLAIFLNRDLHLPLSFYGLLFTLNTLIIVCFELPLNVATMQWPYRLNFILGSFFTTVGFAGLFFATTMWHVVLLAILWTIGEMMLYPAASSYIADMAPENLRGSYMSLLGAASNLGLLLGPFGGALIMQWLGASGLWMICGVFGLLSMLLLSRIHEPQKTLN